MTTLFLVRHGETIWHKNNRYCGSTDIALSPHGFQQADLLARWAAGARLTGLWVSPLIRARQTAEPAVSATGLIPQIDPRLRELNFGEGEGKTIEEMTAAFGSEVITAYQADPVIHHLPGGEDPREALARAIAAFDAIAAAQSSGRVLAITHNGLIRLILCHWLGIPLANYRRLFPNVRNVGITEVRRDGNRMGLIQFNASLEHD